MLSAPQRGSCRSAAVTHGPFPRPPGCSRRPVAAAVRLPPSGCRRPVAAAVRQTAFRNRFPAGGSCPGLSANLGKTLLQRTDSPSPIETGCRLPGCVPAPDPVPMKNEEPLPAPVRIPGCKPRQPENGALPGVFAANRTHCPAFRFCGSETNAYFCRGPITPCEMRGVSQCEGCPIG